MCHHGETEQGKRNYTQKQLHSTHFYFKLLQVLLFLSCIMRNTDCTVCCCSTTGTGIQKQEKQIHSF